MNLLQDVINYVRRIVKTSSNTSLTDSLIVDYINRFWLLDMDARIQLFDLKTKYQFQTTPGLDQYNTPLYAVNAFISGPEPGNVLINQYPVYQGFMSPAYVGGFAVPLYTERNTFYKVWPSYVQNLSPAAVATSGTNYTLSLPSFPAVPGHVDITGIIASSSIIDPIVAPSPLVVGTTTQSLVPITSIYPAVWITATDATGANIVVIDSGEFLQGNVGYGMLINQNGQILNGGYSTTSNTINYATGVVNVNLPLPPAPGTNINAQCYFYQQGLPRMILFYNNCITIRPPPDKQYLIEMDAYLSPAAFMSTGQSLPFAYMSEYIARGASRKILSDTGDTEQFAFYEPLFREQELLVWKRSQRQITQNRTPTIFSGSGMNHTNYGGFCA
jgi:hypothetical protein